MTCSWAAPEPPFCTYHGDMAGTSQLRSWSPCTVQEATQRGYAIPARGRRRVRADPALYLFSGEDLGPAGDYGPDVEIMDRALAEVFGNCTVDSTHVAVEGFSDGASFALSVGLTNGDLFTHVIAFSRLRSAREAARRSQIVRLAWRRRPRAADPSDEPQDSACDAAQRLRRALRGVRRRPCRHTRAGPRSSRLVHN